MEKETSEQPQNNRANILAKARKAISAALLAGMLASPAAAKGIKNQTTCTTEPTRTERSAEYWLQFRYDKTLKLFENIIDSDLNGIEKTSPNEMIKQAPMISDEVKGYIDDLLDCSRRQDDFIGSTVMLEKAVWDGKIRKLGTDNRTGQTGGIDEFILLACKKWERYGIDPRMAAEALWTEYDPIIAKKIFGENKSDLSSLSSDNLSEKMGIKDIICEIMDHPELAVHGKALISKKIKNMVELLPSDVGNVKTREAWLYIYASMDAINARIDRLEKLGYKFNETCLEPNKTYQLQHDLGLDF